MLKKWYQNSDKSLIYFTLVLTILIGSILVKETKKSFSENQKQNPNSITNQFLNINGFNSTGQHPPQVKTSIELNNSINQVLSKSIVSKPNLEEIIKLLNNINLIDCSKEINIVLEQHILFVKELNKEAQINFNINYDDYRSKTNVVMRQLKENCVIK